MANFEPPPLVLVVWEDAKVVDDGPWTEDQSKAYEPHLVHQVGFVILDVPEGIHLTQAWHEKLIAARDQIPRAMIRSITPLVPGQTPKKRGKKVGT